jgi:hypothetical protein
MGKSERIYHASVRALSLAFVGLGIAMVALTFGRGGDPLSVGVLMGIAFIVVGAGRLYVSARLRG